MYVYFLFLGGGGGGCIRAAGRKCGGGVCKSGLYEQ